MEKSSGFTLVELTIVLLIVALLMGGMMIPLSAQRDMQYIRETQQQMEEIKEAILGYAVSQSRLPCPDSDHDGKEDRDGESCKGNVLEGDLPFETLGVAKADAWDHRFRYRVTEKFTLKNELKLASEGDITIQTRGDTSTASKASSDLATKIPVLIISFGKNGYGARTGDGHDVIQMPSDIGDDEKMNIGDPSDSSEKWKKKSSRLATPRASPCSDDAEGKSFCEFDDLVTWISPYVLFNRLIAAGKLP